MSQRAGRLDGSAVLGRIVERAQELVKELQEIAEQSGTAGELEAEMVAVWRQGGAMILGELLSARFGKQEGAGRVCDCGGRQRFEGYRARQMVTLLGKAPVQRAYYRCRECGATHYAGAAELGDAEGGKSLGVQEALGLLSAHLPFEEATDKLERLLGIATCISEAEKHAEGWGEPLEEEWEEEVEAVFEQQLQVLPEACPQRLYVAVDGCKTRLLDQWRETRIGAVYDTQGRDEAGVDRAGRTTYAGLVHRSYHDFGRRLYREALQRGVAQAGEVIVLGDGAPWIWELAAMHFPKATQIVDWYHAAEHLWQVASALYGEGTLRAKAWADRQLQRLNQGQVEKLLRTLREVRTDTETQAEVVRLNLLYFQTNRERMRYDQFRRRGLHIGSGIVESACKQVAGMRLKRNGMRWTQRGAQAVLNLRILDLNGRWDAYWNRQRSVA